jgi:hypothetical protein
MPGPSHADFGRATALGTYALQSWQFISVGSGVSVRSLRRRGELGLFHFSTTALEVNLIRIVTVASDGHSNSHAALLAPVEIALRGQFGTRVVCRGSLRISSCFSHGAHELPLIWPRFLTFHLMKSGVHRASNKVATAMPNTRVAASFAFRESDHLRGRMEAPM